MDFLINYKNIKNIRYDSFELAIKESFKRKHKIIVETGVARGKKKLIFFSKINWQDGMSTLIFANFASEIKGHLYSCDISQVNINNAKKFTKKFSESITFFKDDSVNFLKNFEKKIDFLYLDSLDGFIQGSAEHQLNEIKIAEKKLHKDSLVLLDDKGQKTSLSIKYMLENNFKIINETNEQVLLSY